MRFCQPLICSLLVGLEDRFSPILDEGLIHVQNNCYHLRSSLFHIHMAPNKCKDVAVEFLVEEAKKGEDSKAANKAERPFRASYYSFDEYFTIVNNYRK